MSAGGRLSALDESFLRLESPRAHMHVGWTALFAAPNDLDRPTVQALRKRVASRLDDVPWCRWRLENAPLGLGEPRWVSDRSFELSAHVRSLSHSDEPVSYHTFAALRDKLFSAPLDLSRPPWQIFLVPRLEDGRFGVIGKIHHSLVDGMAALQIVGLVVDMPGEEPVAQSRLVPARHGSPVGWALGHVARAAGRASRPATDGLALVKATAAGAARPRATARAAIRDARRVLRAVQEDLLPRAPDSALNVTIGGRRTLVGYHASQSELRAARAGGGTLNDIGLAVVAGALRTLAVRQGLAPREPLKAMVPVSMRRAGQLGPGNRISMVYIQLPVHLSSARRRLESVRTQTHRLKDGERAENMQTLYAAGGLLPGPLRSPVTKALASPRVFNLTISQSPGPRGVLHVMGSELQEVFSVVPIADGHALAIGMVRYCQELFIGCYADPDALPHVYDLPALLEAEMRALGSSAPVTRPRAVRPARTNGWSPAGSTLRR